MKEGAPKKRIKERPPLKDVFAEPFDLRERQRRFLSGGKEKEYSERVGLFAISDGGEKRATVSISAQDMNLDDPTRPLVVVCQGGPIAASIANELEFSGQRRLAKGSELKEKPSETYIAPMHINLLEYADLLHIDPVGTGFGRALPGNEERYFDTHRDIQVFNAVINGYMNQYKDPSTPIILVASSFAGGFRAPGVALERSLDNPVAAIAAVSPHFNYEMESGREEIKTLLRDNKIGDATRDGRSYAALIPVMAIASQRLGSLKAPESRLTFRQLYEEANTFAREFLTAFPHIDSLTPDEQKYFSDKLAQYTGLPPELITESGFRITMDDFREAIGTEKKVSMINSQFNFPAEQQDTVDIDPLIDDPGKAYEQIAAERWNQVGLPHKDSSDYIRILKAYPQWTFSGIWGEQKAHTAFKHLLIQQPDIKIRMYTGIFDLMNPPMRTEFFLEELKSFADRNKIPITSHPVETRALPNPPDDEGITLYQLLSGHNFFDNYEGRHISITDFAKEQFLFNLRGLIKKVQAEAASR